MSFVIQRASGRGLALTQVRRDMLRIGRGTNAELRSENPAVALEHAVIEGDANGFTITDKGSITGTYVNRRPVETARLARGDVIEIGDLRIEVQVIEPGKPLFVRVSSTSAAPGTVADDDDDVVVAQGAGGARGGILKAPKIDYVDAFRLKRAWLTKLCLIGILLIVAFLVVAEVTKPEKQTAFMPGGVSSAHARAKDANGEPIAKNCRACHDPWRGVSDTSCTECHGKLPHAEQQTGRTGLRRLPLRASRGGKARRVGRRHVRLVPRQPARTRQGSGAVVDAAEGRAHHHLIRQPASRVFSRAAIPTRSASTTPCTSRPAASSTAKGGAKSCNACSATSSSRRKVRSIPSF